MKTVRTLTVTTAIDRHLAELSCHRQYLPARSEHDESVPSVRVTRILAHLMRARRSYRFTVRPATHFRRVLQFMVLVARGLLICPKKKTQIVEVKDWFE